MRWENVPLPEEHLALLGLGVILQRRWGWRLLAEEGGGRAGGWALVAVGVSLIGWATVTAGRIRLAHAEALAMDGPYALSRHPMYVGWTLLFVGAALVANSGWLAALTPLLLALVHAAALAEELELARRFGEDYRRYAARVRRYV